MWIYWSSHSTPLALFIKYCHPFQINSASQIHLFFSFCALHFFLHLHGAALVSLGSTKLRSVFVTTHIISLFRLTLPSLTAVHSEICWLVSLEPRLLYSGPIDLDSVWMRPLSNQHLMNSQCTWSRCNWLKYNHCSPLVLSISGEVSSY